MKVLPVVTITPKNMEVGVTPWHGFEIIKQNGTLVLSKQGKNIALFDLIRLYEKHKVFVGRRGNDYFVVNSEGVISQELTIVADEIFINGSQLYVGVKIRRMGSCYFNVLDISYMDFLFRGEDLQPGKKPQKFTHWPIWERLVDIDNSLMIIEKSDDYFGFYSLNHKRFGLLVDLVENYQKLSQGEYIVYSMVSFGYFKIKSLKEISIENCDGFHSEADTLCQEDVVTTSENECNGLTYEACSVTLKNGCDMMSESSPKYCNLSADSGQDSLEFSIKSCAQYLLSCAPKEKAVLALKTLFQDHVCALSNFSKGVKLYLQTVVDSTSFSELVDDDFIDEIHANLNSDELKDDFNLCRAYFSRNIKEPYELIKMLCEDNLIGEVVKQKVELVRKQRIQNLSLNDAQVLDCFTLYVNEMLYDK